MIYDISFRFCTNVQYVNVSLIFSSRELPNNHNSATEVRNVKVATHSTSRVVRVRVTSVALCTGSIYYRTEYKISEAHQAILDSLSASGETFGVDIGDSGVLTIKESPEYVQCADGTVIKKVNGRSAGCPEEDSDSQQTTPGSPGDFTSSQGNNDEGTSSPGKFHPASDKQGYAQQQQQPGVLTRSVWAWN